MRVSQGFLLTFSFRKLPMRKSGAACGMHNATAKRISLMKCNWWSAMNSPTTHFLISALRFLSLPLLSFSPANPPHLALPYGSPSYRLHKSPPSPKSGGFRLLNLMNNIVMIRIVAKGMMTLRAKMVPEWLVTCSGGLRMFVVEGLVEALGCSCCCEMLCSLGNAILDPRLLSLDGGASSGRCESVLLLCVRAMAVLVGAVFVC